MTLGKSIQRSFWRGLAALFPALLTLVVLSLGLDLVNRYAGQYVNWVIVHVAASVSGRPVEDVQAWYTAYWLDVLGIVGAVVGLCVAAYLLGTLIGARLLEWLESLVIRLPLLRKIYPGAKQVSEFFFSERPVEFRRVVAVQFPRPGYWMVGFVTGRGLGAIARAAGKELVSVFVPTTPAPVTGFVVSVPREEVVDLPLTIDEAFQYLISAGVILPASERANSLRETAAPQAPPPVEPRA